MKLTSCFIILVTVKVCFLQAESYHYLFNAAIKLYQLGLDCATPDHGPIRHTEVCCLVDKVEALSLDK